MKSAPFKLSVMTVTALLLLLSWQPSYCASPAGGPYIYTQWETYYEKDGLPNDHIFALKADGDRLWVGTEGGLALYEKGRWKYWLEKDGLPWKVVSGIDVSPETGDVWLALFGGGLARFSGGRFDHFNQFNSGLVNDVVYGVALAGDTVWAATTAGVSSYNTVTGQWEIYTDKNAPMEEIWCYNADAADGKVYIAVWGGGILEWDQKTRHWNAHRDPDKEMEIDLYRDDGLIHIITTSASYTGGVLWASTYFGLSRYDGRHWRGYMDHDSGLPSNFINLALGRGAGSCYNATDKGLAVLADFKTDTWVTYRKDKNTDKTWTAHAGVGNTVYRSLPTQLTLPNHFVICLEFQGPDLWIGTGHGLARGIGKGYYPGPGKPILAQKSGLPAVEETKKETPEKEQNYGRTPDRFVPFGKFTEPYKQFFFDPLEYHGYGRNLPEPEQVEAVKIGFLGPIEPTVSVATGGASHEESLGKKMLHGATLAIEEANAAGGYTKRNIPYELVVRNDNGLWGASGNEIIHLAYKDDVRAIVGTIDGANSHIAIRVGLKAEVPMMNTGDTDPTFTETAIPWVFRVITDDRQMCYMLADFVFNKLKLTRVAALRANNRYGRIGIDEFRDAARRLGHPFLTEVNYALGDTDFTPQLQRIKSLNPEVVVTYGDAAESALILKQMRAMGMNQWLIGSDRMVSPEFTDNIGSAPGKVVAGFPYNPTARNPRYEKFKRKFKKRFGEYPETYAAHAYDGMVMLIQAIETAGLNRAKIRDQLARIKHFDGVTGEKEFDATYNNISPAALAVLEQGRWVFYSSPEEVGRQNAYKRMKDDPRAFNGPLGPVADPSNLDSIPIGLFAPQDPGDKAAAGLYHGALLAVRQANAKGGFRGVPFRLVHRWAGDPWAAGSKEMIRMVYRDGVYAVMGFRDGASHVAQQIAAKAYVPVLAPVSSTMTLTGTGVPWIFRLPPDDRSQARALVKDHIAGKQYKRIGLVSGTGHDSRTAIREMAKALEQAGKPALFHLTLEPAGQGLEVPVEQVRQFKPDVLVLCLQPAAVASLLKGLDGSGINCPVFLSWTPGITAPQLQQVYRGPLHMLEPFFNNHDIYRAFSRQYEQQFGRKPNYSAAYGYDAAQMIIRAIRTKGLNRPGIRLGLEELAGYEGASGVVVWDNAGGNRGFPAMAGK